MVAANISCLQKLPLWEVKKQVERHRVTKPFLGWTEKSFHPEKTVASGLVWDPQSLRIESDVTNNKLQL